MKKNEIRRQILSIRKNMHKDSVLLLSNIICSNIEDALFLDNISDICLFMPIQNEVDLQKLYYICRNRQINIWLPRILCNSMDFYLYDDNTSLIEGAYHIMEPDNMTKLVPNSTTLVIIPGCVFSVKGDRIGYGGGYYDRYMAMYPACQYIAVCFDFQIMDTIPHEEHDKKPDIIVSDKRIIYISQNKERENA